MEKQKIGTRRWWDKWFLIEVVAGILSWYFFGKEVGILVMLILIVYPVWLYLNNRIDILEKNHTGFTPSDLRRKIKDLLDNFKK